ncbi:hypothetical protein LJC23_00315 [Desulfovibrio sp. OttesenSCG-928-I05]|nr:hypothetical protein [Desulfovibrio sp. OttesenSCG-928-I05]
MNRIFRMRPFALVLALVCASILLASCSSPKKAPSLPPVNMGVAWFTQPAQTADLLAGFLPDGAPRIESKELGQLDMTLGDVLRANTKRAYVFPAEYADCIKVTVPGKSASNRTAALHYWTAVGRCMKVDYLLVPQVIAMRERDGSDAGVISPAAVTMDIFLIDVNESRLVARSHFDEVQTSLSNNLLEAGKFISRGGRWVTAVELAGEGMLKAIEELGL